MRVLHVLYTSYPNISGYSIRSKSIVDHQKIVGFEPVIVTSPRGPDDGSEVWYNGIHYYRTKPLNSLITQLPYLREAAEIQTVKRNMLRILSDNPIDLIHVHSPVLYGLPASSISKQFSIPMVYEIRAFFEDSAVDRGTSTEGSIQYKLTKFLETRLAQKVDAVIGISAGVCNNMISRGISKQKVYLVPNGVDTREFVPLEKDPKLVQRYNLSGYNVLGFIGSFYKFEGLDYLIKGMHRISEYRKDVKLLIVGSGDEESNLKILTNQLGLTNTVIFTGRVPHEEVLKYYSVMDVLVYPRIRTRQTELVTPLKPLEAMSMKKTVICSDVGGLMELVRDGATGIVFRAEDINDLVEKSLFLIGNEEYRKNIGVTARQEVIENRDWSKIILNYKKIYQRALTGVAPH